MSEFINMGPGNYAHNGRLSAPGQPVMMADAEFKKLPVGQSRRLCRRGRTVRDMEREIGISNPKEEDRESRRVKAGAAAALEAEKTESAAKDKAPSPAALNLREAVSLIQGCTDRKQLAAWTKEEAEGKARDGVGKALAIRFDELREKHEEA